jgi:hypothetical protein
MFLNIFVITGDGGIPMTERSEAPAFSSLAVSNVGLSLRRRHQGRKSEAK